LLLIETVLKFVLLCAIQSKKPFWTVPSSQQTNLFERHHITNNAAPYTTRLIAFRAGDLPV